MRRRAIRVGRAVLSWLARMTDRHARLIGVALLLVGTPACGEVVTTHASGTAEARRELEPGRWWPALIPGAATAIVETHDLDTNAQKIVFSLERDACKQAAFTLGASSMTGVAAVPALRLDGWPEWLSSEVRPDTVLQRGGLAVTGERGTLLLTCEDEKGYFWR